MFVGRSCTGVFRRSTADQRCVATAGRDGYKWACPSRKLQREVTPKLERKMDVGNKLQNMLSLILCQQIKQTVSFWLAAESCSPSMNGLMQTTVTKKYAVFTEVVKVLVCLCVCVCTVPAYVIRFVLPV